MALVLLFLYIPIFVLIVFSFNVTKSRSVFSGFTFDWYIKLFHNGLIMKSLLNTVIVATVASIAATILGTAAAIGINNMKKLPRTIVMRVRTFLLSTQKSLRVFRLCFCSCSLRQE